MASTNHSEDLSRVRNVAQYGPFRHLRHKEQGFVLIGALLILLVLVLIGISATTSTVLELQISGAERTHRETFYNAEAGTEIGSDLIEQSINCPGGFTKNDGTNTYALLGPNPPNKGTLYIKAGKGLTLWANPAVDVDGTETPGTSDDLLLANRDASFNYTLADPSGTSVPRVDIQIGGVPTKGQGNNLIQLAGYESPGKNSPSGGINRLYNVHAISYGINNSESWLNIEWRHIASKQGACNY